MSRVTAGGLSIHFFPLQPQSASYFGVAAPVETRTVGIDSLVGADLRLLRQLPQFADDNSSVINLHERCQE